MAGQAQTTGVVCVRCSAPIPVNKVEKVAEEFAVACPKCGHRGIYRIKDIRPIEGK